MTTRVVVRRPEQAPTGLSRTAPQAVLPALCLGVVVLLVLRQVVGPTGHGDEVAATWAGSAASLVVQAAGVITVGWLALIALVLDRSGGPLGVEQVRCLRPAARAAAAWSLVSLGAVALTSVQAGARPGAVPLAAAASAGLLSAAVPRLRSSNGANTLLVLALAALVGPGVLEHVADGHADTTVVAVVLHACAAGIWVGGLCSLLVLSRSAPDVAGAALPRLSGLALLCVVVLASSGLVTALSRLHGFGAVTDTTYGRLVLVKVGLLAVLCGLGALQRRLVLEALPRRGLTATFRRLAAVEVALLFVVLGVAAVLSEVGAAG